MTAMEALLMGLVGLGSLYWLVNTLLVVHTVRCVPVLEHLRPGEPQSWPKLSLVIPACNEAGSIEPATKSRLHDDYPNLEVVLVDDRSDDGTSQIIDRLAAADNRVRALHITELPDRWLGKVHALHRGMQAATGEWLLFSDADVHVEPGTLRRTIAYCLQRELDFLTVVPQVRPRSFLLGCVFAMLIRMICLAMRPWSIGDPRSTASTGVGAFNLVRRSALERTGGFAELRLTVVDDVALGQMLKQAGARCAVANGRHRIWLHFYATISEAVRGTEKSVLVAFRFSYLCLVTVWLALLWLELSPIVALLLGIAREPGAGLGDPTLRGPGSQGLMLTGLGLSSVILALFSSLVINRWLRMPLVPAVFFPIGLLLSFGAVARGAVLAAWRGGHMWRGVLYPTGLLREGNRLRFP